jgi:hypothetical protein
MSFQSVFDQTWDVVVVGAGYAGLAAAWQSRQQGRRVLLLDREPAILRESGWSFSQRTGDSAQPLWREWLRFMEAHGALQEGLCDGAAAEVLATELCRARALPVLYYAAPVSALLRDGLLAAVLLATKSGLQRLAATQWIDATEEGELSALFDAAWSAPRPQRREWNLHFRAYDWMDATDFTLSDAEREYSWEPSLWRSEHVLRVRSTGEARGHMDGWLPGLRALHESGQAHLESAVLTHGSIVPFAEYSAPERRPLVPENVALACASLLSAQSATLAGRFEAGVLTAQNLDKRPCAEAIAPHEASPSESLPATIREISADVAVAGLGTGGAMAAIAAAREGAQVAAFDALPFPGGIGAGGGIHWYYFGVCGGMQQELDDRVREIMPLFGTTAQIRGFHPDAKKLVLEAMLGEAGVLRRHGALLFGTRRDGERVTEAVTSTPGGPLIWKAKAWVDATGDGDLSVLAGAAYHWGRDGDGRLLAYSQSSGRAAVDAEKKRAVMEVVNFDAGFCDPTDAEDLTRARQVGVLQYVQDRYDAEERPTYIAPAIGLRQSRHIETEYTVTLADLIERRTFPDAVGYTGSHLDTHALDFEFESDEALFWVWVCRQWRGRMACEIPYRTLLPRGLSNVWLGCRALGMTPDAHYCVRMQRDMQRVGEVAGYAAALAAANETDSRNISFDVLLEKLETTGAVTLREVEEDSFGPRTETAALQSTPAPAEERIASWVEELQSSPSGDYLWHLYRAGEAARDPLLALLDSDDDTTSWRAAAVLAMLGERRAMPRLLQAVEAKETGDGSRDGMENEVHYAPRWLIALSLLRRCGDHTCLPVFEELAADAGLVFNARSAIALTGAALAKEHPPAEGESARWAAVLERLVETEAPGAVHQIQSRLPLSAAELEVAPGDSPRDKAIEDFGWQLHLAVAKARAALGLPLHDAAWAFLEDERALVRRSFTALVMETQTENLIPV